MKTSFELHCERLCKLCRISQRNFHNICDSPVCCLYLKDNPDIDKDVLKDKKAQILKWKKFKKYI